MKIKSTLTEGLLQDSPAYSCSECGKSIDEDDVVWVDPETGEATTGDKGKPFCVGCAPNQY